MLKDLIGLRTLFCSLRGVGIKVSAKMSSHESYINLKSHVSTKHRHPAAERNKEPILQALKKYIDVNEKGYFMEISSGSGQHVSHFAPNFTGITFQPTEVEKSSLKSINEYVAECPSGNIKDAQFLDVREPPNMWLGGSLESGSVDYILNVNMMHISEWACSQGLFKGAGELLKKEGYLFTYGPYAFNGSITPESNVNFNASLRAQNPSWGLRDVPRELEPLANANGIFLESKHDLPANNNFLVWRKK
ncbi:methyltransferase-like 26 [Halyomorpha halys]|uniref:methyltransferase-like 26 n=1 Tax=Halyomorpha halys TaxID=286706 RepID=UPI0006D4D4E5|nr:methyltransferase-like 26 [Halyomorpha halys]